MPTPYYPGITVTPNLGLSLIGMDEVVAEDFILIDAFAGGVSGSIEVNGVLVNNPNFVDSTTAVFSVVGSDISITASGGTGTVTSFSSGDLSPLFTTSVADPTTTPALSFVLSNAAQNSVFAGPSSGGAGAPTYRALVASDIPPLSYLTNPMTTLGDLMYEDAVPSPVRLAGNITTTKKYLSQTGNGSISAAPAWSQVAFGDIAAGAIANGTTATTQSAGDSSNKVATDEFVQTAIGGAFVPQIVTSGLIGQYAFTDGSGSTLTDSSGNGNNGTLGASTHAPTWVTGGGLTFSHASQQYVSFPAALNAARTVQIFYTYQTLASVGLMDLMASTVGSPNGISLSVNNNSEFTGSSAGANGFSNPGFTVFGDGFVLSKLTANGIGLLTFLLGSSSDSTYDTVCWNNHITATMSSQLQSAGIAGGAGVFQLGGSSIVNSYFNGTVYYMAVYNRLLTTAEILTNYDFMYSVMQLRGVQPTGPNNISTTTNQLVASGDSITMGYLGTAYTTLLSLNGTWAKGNIGVPGQLMATMVAEVQAADIPELNKTAGKSVAVIWGGTNDITAGTSADTVLSYLESYCKQVRAAGYKVIPVTMLSRNGEDTGKNTYNTLIRENWESFADALADVAANPLLGADGAYANSTYFNVDGIHPKTAGDTIAAAIIQQSVNRLYGNRDFSSANVYTTSTTQVDADYCIVLSGSTAGQTLTLETAVGYTGQSIFISNESTQTWTIAAYGSETISGSATFSLAAGVTIELQSILVSASAGGANWIAIVSSSGSGSSVSVNGTPVSSPNFKDSATVTFGVSGSDISLTASGGGGSTTWDTIGNAAGNLTLSNAAYTTEFDQTSNVAWLWKNTTAGTALTTNASPVLKLAANCFHGGASTQDTWSIGSSLAAGTDAISTLTISHSGSSGAAQISLPAPLSFGVTDPQIIGPDGATTGVSIGAVSGVALLAAVPGGSGDFIRGYQNGSYQGSISSQNTSLSFGLYHQNTGGSAEIGVANAPGATLTHPLVSLGHGGTGWATTGAGPYVGINMGQTFALGGSSSLHLNWAPTAGAGNFYAVQIAPTVNQTSSASGSYTALRIAVTETALLGTSNKLIDCYVGSSGATEVFAVDNTGKITEYAGVATASQGVPSEIVTVDLTAQSAAIGATNIIASVPATGMYRVAWSATITTAGTTSILGGSAGFQVGYTSPTDSVAKLTVSGNSTTSSANTTGTAVGGSLVVYAKTGTAITYQMDYTSTGTSMVYELHIKLERM